MPDQAFWRLSNAGNGQPGPVQTIELNEQLTGKWAVVTDIPPDTDYQLSLVSATGPWENRRTLPMNAIPADRIPVIHEAFNGRGVAKPAIYYEDRRDEFADPVTHPHIMGVTHRTVKSGRFTDPTVWDTGTVPGAGSVWAVAAGHVLVGDNNSDVIFKDALVEFGGTFRLANDTDTKWRLDTFMSMTNLILVDKGVSATPGKTKHQFIWHIQQAPGTTTRGGLMAMGKVRIHGAKKKSFLRVGLSAEQIALGETAPAVKAGATRVYLPGLSQSGWRIGQRLMFGGTQHQPLATSDPQWTGPTSYYSPHRNKTGVLNRWQFGQEEERIISGFDGDWALFDTPLVYDHIGIQRTLPRGQVITIAPVVGNPSQSIEFRGASAALDGHLDPAADLTDLQKRAHPMFMGDPDVDVRYCSWRSMGRTSTDPTLVVNGLPATMPSTAGQIQSLLTSQGGAPIANPNNVRGRYAGPHIHWCGGPYLDSPLIPCIGVTVWASLDEPPLPGWGITQHASRVAIEDCFVFNCRGASFVSELGNENGQWARNLAMFCRGDGEGHGFSDRHETHDNMNGAAGVGFENQSRMILMHGNIAVSCRYAYLWHAQKSSMVKRQIRDIDMRFLDGTRKGLGLGNSDRLNESIGPWRAQIPPFIDNEAHACEIGFEVTHRLSGMDWAIDQTPMLLENYHCLDVKFPFRIPEYSNNYYVKDCLWKAPAAGGVAAALGNVSYGWNFANIHAEGYQTKFVDEGAGVNYDGFFIDIADTPGAFTNAPTMTRTGLTSSAAWNVMGDAEVIDANSGRPRRYKPITTADLPQPYPAKPYGYGGELPAGYTFPKPGEPPYFIPGNIMDPSRPADWNPVTSGGDGRGNGRYHGAVVDSVGVRRWPDGQSSENNLANFVVRAYRTLDLLQSEQLLQRWGCWWDGATLKSRAWFPIADRSTHVRAMFHIDFTVNVMDPKMIAEHLRDSPAPAPDWPDKLEAVPEHQQPLVPETRTLSFLSRTRAEAVADQQLSLPLVVDGANVRFSIVGGADAAAFGIAARQLQWASNGTRARNGGDANGDNVYEVIVRAQDAWGNSVDTPHQVVVVPSARVSAEVLDSFARADENLEANPAYLRLRGPAGAFAIRSNKVDQILTSSPAPLYDLGSLGSSDQHFLYQMAASGPGGLVFRKEDENNYLLWRGDILSMCKAGVTTELARYWGTFGTGRVIVKDDLVAIGTYHTGYKETTFRYPRNGYYTNVTPLEHDPRSFPGAVRLPADAPRGTNYGLLGGTSTKTGFLTTLEARRMPAVGYPAI